MKDENNGKKQIKIPYSTGYKELIIDSKRVKAILNSRTDVFSDIRSCDGQVICEPKFHMQTQEDIVRKALEKPINSERLGLLAKNAAKILIITSDHTRPVPSKITMPLLLEEIRSMNTDVEIKILIATGFHRVTTYKEMVYKFGNDLIEKENFIVHNSRDIENMVFKGILPSGGELWLNSLIDWADLIVSEGFIEPHFFAGFSGGRKSILPGIASEKTVFANHCSKFIANNSARTGNLDKNPIHEDMIFASRIANLGFILNVAIDSEKKIIEAFAGHPEEAHEEGCKFVAELARVDAVKSDIVITSNGGYPLDQNIYQAVKGMTAAEVCVNAGGVIIMVAECGDGHGGEDFYHWFTNATSAKEVAERISKIPQEDTLADQWEAQILARILMKSEVIIVTDKCDPNLIKNMHMHHAFSLKEAINMAEKTVGKDADVVVIPDGVGVIVEGH
jgi:nickel-dependent lactate racemase